MAAKKCCRCSLLSCFACFSETKNTLPAQLDSSKIAPSSLNVIANASSAAPSPVASATAASPPNASGEIQLAAASSQGNANSTDVVLQNGSQPIASSTVPSSSQPIVTSFASGTSSQTIVSPLAHPPDHNKGFQVGSSSNPSSSSVPKQSDHSNNIREAAAGVDIENADADLNELINYISQLLDFIKIFGQFLDKDQEFMSRLAAKLEETGLRTYRRGVSYINDPFLEFSTNSSEFKGHHINDSKG